MQQCWKTRIGSIVKRMDGCIIKFADICATSRYNKKKKTNNNYNNNNNNQSFHSRTSLTTPNPASLLSSPLTLTPSTAFASEKLPLKMQRQNQPYSFWSSKSLLLLRKYEKKKKKKRKKKKGQIITGHQKANGGKFWVSA